METFGLEGATAYLNAITDGLISCDRQGRITFVNQRATEIFCQSPEALLGRSVREIGTTGVCKQLDERCDRALSQHSFERFEIFFRHLNQWLEVRIYPDENGCVILLQDVSVYKQREKALEQTCDALEHELIRQALRLRHTKASLHAESVGRTQAETALALTNGRLASVLESITDGVCAFDHEWRFSYVNRRVANYLQREQNELLGKVIWEAYPQILDTSLYYYCQQVVDTGRSVQFEEFCQPLNLWLEYRIYPSAEGVSLYFHDISARKQAEMERQRSLEQAQASRRHAEMVEGQFAFLSEVSRALANSLDYQETLSTLMQSVVPALADYCIMSQVESNCWLRPLMGVHRNPEKQPLIDEVSYLYQSYSRNPSSIAAQILRDGQPVLVCHPTHEMVTSITQDQRLLELYTDLNPQSMIIAPLSARGRVIGTLLLTMSESGRTYTQADLALATEVGNRAAIALDNAQLYRQAEESLRLKDEFLGSISHELRTPLNAIVGWSKLLHQRPLRDEIFTRGIETIQRNAKDLTQLVYDLLDMSCVVAGRMHLDSHPVDLLLLVQEATASLQVAIDAKSIDVRVNCEGTIGMVRGDNDRLHQVVWHLLSNAIKFTPEGGQVTVRLGQRDRFVELEVSDSGTGIRPSFLPHVFDAFRQGNGSTTRAYGGLGIGLSLVNYLVEMHGGRVEVFSAGEGQGTTVKVLLPQPR